jgi:adenylate cyclase
LCCTIFIVFYDASVTAFKSEIGDGTDYNFGRLIGVAILSTLAGASILGTLEVLVLNRLFRKKPYGFTLIFKTLVYLLFILTFLSIVVIINFSAEINHSVWSSEVLYLYFQYVTSIRFIMTAIYWGIACFLASFFLQVNDKFGQGVLLNFLRGKYHHPLEEKRIFMFMDLKSSTTHAENLGHIRYSQFIQDCFFDLTDVVTRFGAQIYQYVGDEVVLSWTTARGSSHGNCINTFFAYNDILDSRRDHYNQRYGITPEFKAGINVGSVTVAEVGEIKKELAYHGDVLNTAARIQSTCNQYQKKLLVSEQLKQIITDYIPYTFEFMGSVILKGKQKRVNIYAVESDRSSETGGD